MATTTYTVFVGEVISENRAGTETDYVPDPLGSTVALLNSSQSQTDTFNYWPYGEQESRTGSTDTPFRFVGTLSYYRDSADRTYVRARTYLQGYGRWMTVDPLWPAERPFQYARCSPVAFTDPSGRCICSFKGKRGRLLIDCSCAGAEIGIIPEKKGKTFIDQPCCDKWYDADGYALGSQLYKVWGSTCIKICCFSRGGRRYAYVCECCVNHIAGTCWFGAKCPKKFPPGTWSKSQEPPAGNTPGPVKRCP
ncbi:MAG: hypothetical protein IH851_08150 [Armatimonadetes bacterium]|nr:hypothetical protein [Armatimonadota bacterium]